MASPSPDDPAGSKDRLLAHADSLYAVAHALTLNAAQASTLVENTYRRAAASSLPADVDERIWLLGLLRAEAGLTGDERTLLSASTTTGDFRRSLGERAARRVMPVAFAGLPPAEREILTLHYVERLSLEAIGAVLGTNQDVAEARVAVADASLRTAVINELAPGERSLLGELSEGWVRDAMNDMAVHEVPVLPPTLRPVIGGSSNGTPARKAANASQAKRGRKRADLSSRLQRALAVASIVFFTGLIGYVASRVLESPPDTSVISIAARVLDRPRIELATDSIEDVEAFIEERTGWRVAVPQIEGAHLVGVRISEPAPGARVPTIVYADDEDGGRLVVMAYTYTLIDQHADRLRFDRETLEQIEDEGRYDLHDLGGKQVLVWRHRSAIFVAATEGQAEALHDRVYRSS